MIIEEVSFYLALCYERVVFWIGAYKGIKFKIYSTLFPSKLCVTCSVMAIKYFGRSPNGFPIFNKSNEDCLIYSIAFMLLIPSLSWNLTYRSLLTDRIFEASTMIFYLMPLSVANRNGMALVVS